jgi:hypothetical protein
VTLGLIPALASAVATSLGFLFKQRGRCSPRRSWFGCNLGNTQNGQAAVT